MQIQRHQKLHQSRICALRNAQFLRFVDNGLGDRAFALRQHPWRWHACGISQGNGFVDRLSHGRYPWR